MRYCLTHAGNSDLVDFAIPGSGVQTIELEAALPTISNSITIEGFTQGGSFNDEVLVQIDGQDIVGNGLNVTAGGVTITGLGVYGFGGDGVKLDGAGDVISGCLIGTDANGDAGIGNGTGVILEGPNDILGDVTGATTTVISGNKNDGVDAGGVGILITNCLIGTGLTGLTALGNGATGIMLAGGAGNDTINWNVIAGQNGNGIGLQGSQGTLIFGNDIGVGKDGKTPVGNTLSGVYIGDTCSHIQIGTLLGRNIIAGNGGDGVVFDGCSTSTVSNNYIGLDINGNVQGNAGYGVVIKRNDTSGTAATQNVVGGTTPLTGGNVISANGKSGVIISDGATQNVVQGNYIGTNKDGTAGTDGNGAITGNILDGVTIQNGSSLNTVGGTPADSLNVISGNLHSGVVIDEDSNGNLVSGDYIGTDVDGKIKIANDQFGVAIRDSNTNTIGTVAPALWVNDPSNEKNSTVTVISGNANTGVFLDKAQDTLIQNCYIGTDVTGTIKIGNTNGGIYLQEGSSSNTIGDVLAGSGNVISGNGSDGIAFSAAFPQPDGTDLINSYNLIQGNNIGTDVSGLLPLGNTGNGILFQGGLGNTVGGGMPGAQNTISANSDYGVGLETKAIINEIQNNTIGVNRNGINDPALIDQQGATFDQGTNNQFSGNEDQPG